MSITSGARGLSGRGPDFFSISYVQGRSVGGLATVPDTVRVLQAAGFREVPLDEFYDIQVNRRRHAARVALGDVTLRFPAEGEEPGFIARGYLNVLLWSVGFAVLRVTFTDSGMQRPSAGFRTWFRRMHELYDDVQFPGPPPQWSLRIAGVPLGIPGGARRFFDAAGYAMHEVMNGRVPDAAAVSAWAASSGASLDHADALVARGELRYPYAVTFGTHSELVWDSRLELPRDPGTWIPGLMGSGDDGQAIATDLDEPLHEKWWFMAEFQSVVVGVSGGARPGGDVADLVRAEIIEYIALRRAGIMAIQRETAKITAEGQPVKGARVADWMWLMSALTNDYVLSGQSGPIFARVRRKFLGFDGIRNMFDLEEQVKRNIESFQGRLDAESDRAGIVTGVLFGIVAATALVPLGELLVIFVFRLGTSAYANFPVEYPGAFVGVVIGMLAIVAGVSWHLLRRANALRPPRNRRTSIFSRLRLPRLDD